MIFLLGLLCGSGSRSYRPTTEQTVGYTPFPITVHEVRKIPFLVRQPWTQKLHQIERSRETLGSSSAGEIGEGRQRGGEVEPEVQRKRERTPTKSERKTNSLPWVAATVTTRKSRR
jgi:hypothetical protein